MKGPTRKYSTPLISKRMWSVMSSWNRIVLPFTQEISPDMVKIGEMAWDGYRRAGEPQGFAMFHATEGPGDGEHDKWIVYLTPVASEVCREISENYPFEALSRPPARDEP